MFCNALLKLQILMMTLVYSNSIRHKLCNLWLYKNQTLKVLGDGTSPEALGLSAISVSMRRSFRVLFEDELDPGRLLVGSLAPDGVFARGVVPAFRALFFDPVD